MDEACNMKENAQRIPLCKKKLTRIFDIIIETDNQFQNRC